MQRASDSPKHVGIIMDGNGRWAMARGLERTVGHWVGAEVLEGLFTAAVEEGVEVVTLYAFSADNWSRSSAEVAALMRLFRRYLDDKARTCRERGIRLQVIGRRDRLSDQLVEAVARAEWMTRRGRTLLVRVAIDYSSRQAILRAASAAAGASTDGPTFKRLLAEAIHSDVVPDPDLIVRTGGEQRLSDFLLWESAYAELLFLAIPWPEFSATTLRECCASFRSRQRRYGGVPTTRGA